MALSDSQPRLTQRAAARVIVDEITARSDGPDVVGIEVELFPIRRAGHTRVALDESLAILTDASIGSRESSGGNPQILLPSGGAITFEPGGQIELVAPASADPEQAFGAVRSTIDLLVRTFDAHAIELVGVGMDPCNDAKTIPQQLPGGRYVAMAEYFDGIGPWGRVMMRNTASVQVSLDVQDHNRDQRWRLANLVAPIATATFANSPTAYARSTRSYAWQHLDPTRTGIPTGLHGSAMDAYAEMALAADVMLFWQSPTVAHAGRPGFSFRDWIDHGHPDHGYPSADSLRYHLTTLFPEVRLRANVMELRSVDSLPYEWATVPAVLLSGAIYDDAARSELICLLGSRLHDVTRDLRTAAVHGLRDPDIAATARRVWQIALDGARRHWGNASSHVDAADAFLRRFTDLGISPGDLQDLSHHSDSERSSPRSSRTLEWEAAS